MPPSIPTAPADSVLLAAGLGDPALLALALCVAIVSAWLAFQLFWRASGDTVPTPLLVAQATSSAALGCGIWSAQFIALLALDLPGEIGVHPGLALLSMLPGVLCTFAAFFWLRHRGTEPASLAVAGVLVGIGIASVRQASLMAAQETLAIHLAPAGVVLSLATASTFSVVSLLIALRRPRRLIALGADGCLTLAGIVMGLGVLCSHGLGLLGAAVDLPRMPQPSGDTSRLFVAMAVALVTLAFTAFAISANAFMRYREVYRDVSAKETWQRALLDTAVDGVIAFDIDGRIVDCNTAAERIFGWTCAELTGRGIGTLIPVGDSTRIELRQLVDQVADESPAGVTREVQGLRRDGSIIPLRVATGHAQLRGRDRFVAFVSDMTARKAMEQALRDSEMQMRSLIGNVPGVVYRRRIDPATERLGSFVFMSDAVARVTGHSADEFLGERARRHISELVHPEDLPALREQVAHSISDRRPFSVEYRLRHADGRDRWVWSQGGPVAGPDGRLQWMDGAMLDITERRGMESELREAKERAERAAEARSAFLANMSHEIRTPMNSILGFTEVLLQGELAAEQRRHLDTVRGAGQSLLRLLNEILDTAKLDRGAVELEYADFDLLALVDELSSTLGMEARRKGLTLDVRFDAALERRVHGDPLRVRQVLTNLIANAVKFTESGGVLLTVSPHAPTARFDDPQPFATERPAAPSSANLPIAYPAGQRAAAPGGATISRGGSVHFSIRDTGIGIPAHRLDAIFDPFIQADASMSRRFGGTGLGTTISKKLVELMGGRIDVESRVGEGSSFHVRLPFERARAESTSQPDPRTAPSMPLPPLHVLIADDVPQNIELLSLYLSLQGHRTTTAVNGAEAARLAMAASASASASDRFDLVLMDVQMPELDGLQATRRIREHEQRHGLSPVPVIALTASVLDADRLAARESGMDGFASKPVDIEMLTREMARVLKHGTVECAPFSAPEPLPPSPGPASALPSASASASALALASAPAPASASASASARPVTIVPSAFAVLDADQGLARWMHRRDAYRRELRRFADQQAGLPGELADALSRSSHPEIAALAHRARGAAANLGLDRIAEALRRIEEASRSDRSSFVAQAVVEVPAVMNATTAAIHNWLAADGASVRAAPVASVTSQDEHELRRLSGSLAQALRRGVLDESVFARLHEGLQGRADPHRLRELRQAIEDFDFGLAEARLDAIVASLAPQRLPAHPPRDDVVDIDIDSGIDIEIL